jgi:hypothetical protein
MNHSLLVVRQSQRAHAAVARRECVEERQVKGAPNLHNSFVASGHQVLAIAA